MGVSKVPIVYFQKKKFFSLSEITDSDVSQGEITVMAAFAAVDGLAKC